MKGDGLSRLAVETWQTSRLRTAIDGADELLVDAHELEFAAGMEIPHLTASSDVIVYMFLSGMARTFADSPDGRQLTFRYYKPGDVMGIAALLLSNVVTEGMMMTAQAVTRCQVLRLSRNHFRQMVLKDPQNVLSLLTELVHSLMHSRRLIADNVFQPIRLRTARHLLDLAEWRSGELSVSASQQDLADAIGSVRAVVSRTLIELRDEGLIHRAKHRYVIADPMRLHQIAFPVGTAI